MTENANAREPEARRAFFAAADQTLREGGLIHSELIATRAGGTYTSDDLLKLMTEWCASRQYPLAKLTWTRFGAAVMIFVGVALLGFSLALVSSARRGRDAPVALAGFVAISGVGLIVTGIRMWAGASRLRAEKVERARTICPECQKAVNRATGQCPCGYLSSSGAAGQPSPAMTADVPQTGDRVETAERPAAAAATIAAAKPTEVVWEVESSGATSRLTGVEAIRSAILSGRVHGATRARVPATDANAESPPWSTARELAPAHFALRVLYEPVWAHTVAGGMIGAWAGIVVWVLGNAYSLFFVAENPVAGAVVLLFTWGIVNQALPPKFEFFSSRIFWGALSLSAMVSYQNYGANAFSKGVVPGVGVFFGAVVGGLLAGSLSGMSIGTLVGYFRRGLPRAPDAVGEGSKPVIYGLLVPAATLVAVVFVYFNYVVPWLVKLLATRR